MPNGEKIRRGAPTSCRKRGAAITRARRRKAGRAGRDEALRIRRGCGVSIQTRDILMLVISLATAVCSLCLYVAAVLYRARAASRISVLSFLAFGALAAVMLLR